MIERRRVFFLLLMALFALSAPLGARAEDATDPNDPPVDEDEPTPRQLRPRTVSRQPNSYGNYVISRGEGRRASAAKIYEVHFGAAAGVSAASNTQADPGVSNLALNATLDARAWKYFGVEGDVHGDLISAKYYGNSTGSATLPTTKVSRDYLFAGKMQYPFWWGNVRVIPKGGGGYGYMATNYVNPLSGPAASSGATTTETSQLTEVAGFFGLLGVDVEVTPQIVFFADYARAFGAHGTVVVNSAQAADLTNAGFDRIRAGGYYRLGPNWGLGAQFVRRSATFDSVSGDGSQSDNTQMQFLGLLMFEL